MDIHEFMDMHGYECIIYAYAFMDVHDVLAYALISADI